VLDVVFPPAATAAQKQAYADFAKAFRSSMPAA
jgi:curved DNA-binding protein